MGLTKHRHITIDMASMHKTYFMSPSWDIDPSEVALGSVITDLNSPHKPLSAETLPSKIHTTIVTNPGEDDKDEPTSGMAKASKKWSAGLFATFIHVITLGGQASYSSSSTSEVKYSCESMKTSRFTPSPAFITQAAEDAAVKAHLKIGGIGAKAFVVTGVKTVRGVTITTTEEIKQDANIHLRVEIPAAQAKFGPKWTNNPTGYQTHTINKAGSIVFAFQVEKLRVNRKGQARSKEFVDGAMLGRKDDIEYVIERDGEKLDEDEMEDFGLEACMGIEDEDGAECRIIVPSSD